MDREQPLEKSVSTSALYDLKSGNSPMGEVLPEGPAATAPPLPVRHEPDVQTLDSVISRLRLWSIAAGTRRARNECLSQNGEVHNVTCVRRNCTKPSSVIRSFTHRTVAATLCTRAMASFQEGRRGFPQVEGRGDLGAECGHKHVPSIGGGRTRMLSGQ